MNFGEKKHMKEEGRNFNGRNEGTNNCYKLYKASVI
jgi:hypothetical protein